ncbi:MAG: hypothetical protein M1839_005092 [Geoglossum umbratile]|nr:MAG: hypothetical protein M1839_005092 [Geoglossum umbratile]
MGEEDEEEEEEEGGEEEEKVDYWEGFIFEGKVRKVRSAHYKRTFMSASQWSIELATNSQPSRLEPGDRQRTKK